MKRFLALLAVGAAVMALLPVSAGAVDTQGPPCADIVFGDGSYTLLTSPPSLAFRFDLASPSCAAVTDTLDIYDLSSGTLLATQTISGVSGATSLSFSKTFTGVAPAGVCLVGTTSLGRHVADRAPDTGCAAFPADEPGGVGFQ
ncbi:MAG: hypothetical protein K0S82_276 [Gaiellaceae bacterium]|nr:hypothetical protein [Gaiellaceae bacterium]